MSACIIGFPKLLWGAKTRSCYATGVALDDADWNVRRWVTQGSPN